MDLWHTQHFIYFQAIAAQQCYVATLPRIILQVKQVFVQELVGHVRALIYTYPLFDEEGCHNIKFLVVVVNRFVPICLVLSIGK